MHAPDNPEVTRFLNAWFQVRQFIQAANFNRFQGEGLSATQFMTLNLLPSKGEGVPMGELARRMNLAPATVAKTVDSLEARQLAARVKSAGDKRLVRVEITPAGAALQNTADGHFRKQIAELFAAMQPEERDALLRGLESFVHAAEQPSRSAPPSATPARAHAAPRAKRSARRSPRP